jgi:hypothetical protein
MSPAFAFRALAALGLAACNWPTIGGSGSSGSSGGTGNTAAPQTAPPVIDALDMPPSVSESGAFYVIQGSITYHDDDDVVVSASVHIPVIGKTIPVAIDPAYQTSAEYGIPFAFQVSDDVPLGGAGPTSYSVTLINKSGAQSQPFQETIDLQ